MRRFLVVDEDAPSRDMLCAALSESAVCDTAENGNMGIELFEQAILSGKPYDLVCADICMSEMDGHEMIEKIRDFEISYKPRIFVITSSSCANDMSRALLNNDCDEYMLKPFRRDSLYSILNKYKLLNNNTH